LFVTKSQNQWEFLPALIKYGHLLHMFLRT
jgi:hypothetical protein